MISWLSGTLRQRVPEELVIDVGGVGYQVFVSLQTFAALPASGSPIELLTYTHVREDSLMIFGFRESGEKSLFLLLTEVSGIGPRLALNILSGVPADELRQALRDGNVARLVAIPGVGRKTAERMVLELREKVARIPEGPTPAAAGGAATSDAISALLNLGYRRADAERAVEVAARGGAAGFPDLIRDALREISR